MKGASRREKKIQTTFQLYDVLPVHTPPLTTPPLIRSTEQKYLVRANESRRVFFASQNHTKKEWWFIFILGVWYIFIYKYVFFFSPARHLVFFYHFFFFASPCLPLLHPVIQIAPFTMSSARHIFPKAQKVTKVRWLFYSHHLVCINLFNIIFYLLLL